MPERTFKLRYRPLIDVAFTLVAEFNPTDLTAITLALVVEFTFNTSTVPDPPAVAIEAVDKMDPVALKNVPKVVLFDPLDSTDSL
jgi:hypothetical protein